MRKGFTILELIATIAIIVILGLVAVFNLQGGKNSTDLTDTTKQIGSLLREAQSDSVSQEMGATWGVYFSNVTSTAPFFAMFTTSFSTSTQVNYTRLPSTVGYSATFLASGATTSITFSEITGAASASTTIGLYSVKQTSLTSVITVASSGAVSD